MDIKIVKLVTGEQLLTEFAQVGPEKVQLTKPMMLIPGPEGIQTMPWLMLAKKEEVVIEKCHIMAVFDPKDELVNGYKQQVGAIVTAPANALNDKGKLVL